MTDTAAALRGASAWFASGRVRVAPLGAGHINDTWLLRAGHGEYVLQRISTVVFPDPVGLCAKVASVVEHVRRSGLAAVPELLRTRAGEPWHEDAGGVWRMWRFVANARTLAALDSPGQAFAAGRAFGRLQLALADVERPVPDPIPGFMQLSHYLAELDAARAEPAKGVGAADPEVRAALATVSARRDLAGSFQARDRLVHGDCKVDNLLFHPDRDEVVCIVDLDTVMRGHWAWDFGDLARSAAARDERFDAGLFAAVVRGFVGSGAIDRDVEALTLAPRYVTLMLGVRFLADHLRGDRYFKVSAPGDNLIRARRQLALLEDMERQRAALRRAAAG